VTISYRPWKGLSYSEARKATLGEVDGFNLVDTAIERNDPGELLRTWKNSSIPDKSVLHNTVRGLRKEAIEKLLITIPRVNNTEFADMLLDVLSEKIRCSACLDKGWVIAYGGHHREPCPQGCRK
jgi:hypothetical protein